jgi:uncharacterized membrane protein YsdA (DUF1294 family)
MVGWLCGVYTYADYACSDVHEYAFFLYWSDKLAAKRGDRRTPENTLHMIALCGGWPGALLAQQFLRHKSNKASFQTVYWLTVGINLVALGWLASDDGATLRQKLESLI